MICEITNWEEKWTSKMMLLDSFPPEEEVTLGYFLITTGMFIMALIFISWWLIPISISYSILKSNKLLGRKFYCNRTAKAVNRKLKEV